jgi:exopolysaccharide biosynthesis polyprenyl glycosylphosphotransferase
MGSVEVHIGGSARAEHKTLRGGKRLRIEAQLRLHPSERRLLLAAGDLLLLNASLALGLASHVVVVRAGLAAATPPVLPAALWQTGAWFLLLSVLWLAVAVISDAYDLALAAAPYRSAYRTGGLALLVGASYLVIPHLIWSEHQSGSLFLPLLGAAAVGLWRIAYARVLAQPTFDQTALVIGAGYAGRTIARAIAYKANVPANPLRGTGFRLLGYVDDDPALQEQLVEGVPVLGTRHDLLSLVHALQPDSLIVAINQPNQVHPELMSTIVDCAERGVRIIPMPALYERLLGRVPVEHTGGNPYVALYLEHGTLDRLYGALWRLIDICVGLLGCSAMAAVIPWIWLANRISSPGDLFYRQARVGQGGRIFQVIKFRSMIMNAERESGAVWAREGDSRITPAGRILRKTRLDEVPQFWNVLKGDMALIGPRPERPEFVTQLAEQIPYYRARHAVRPGITGWAQVKYGYGNSVDDARVKLEHDLYYLKHRGLYLDLRILLESVRVVLRMEGM